MAQLMTSRFVFVFEPRDYTIMTVIFIIFKNYYDYYYHLLLLDHWY